MMYLNTTQVATILDTSPQVIRNSRSSGILFGQPAPLHIKFGQRKVIYSTDEIERWVSEYGRVSRVSV